MRASGPDAVRQLTKVGRGLRERGPACASLSSSVPLRLEFRVHHTYGQPEAGWHLEAGSDPGASPVRWAAKGAMKTSRPVDVRLAPMGGWRRPRPTI
eukprot:scaffold25477_cov60-Phaeocystis_antarctica.AAC.1